jgi:hypothetical protein
MNPNEPVSYNSSPRGGRGILLTIVLVILLIAALGFGGYEFSQAQDYKNNSDKKSAAAVAAAEKTQAAQLQTKFDEQNKSPFKNFQSAQAYGAISFNYPKSWSAYVDTTSSNEPVNGYFFPDTVPGVSSKSAFALRVELVTQDYSQLVRQFSSQIKAGKVTARAYLPPKMSGVTHAQAGTLFSGLLSGDVQAQNGTMLIIPVRDKSLKIYTESNQNYQADFMNTVLGSLTFTP